MDCSWLQTSQGLKLSRQIAPAHFGKGEGGRLGKWATEKPRPGQGTACVCAQLCPILWDPMDYSPPGSTIYGIFQARILEWVALSFYKGSTQPKDWSCVHCIGLHIIIKVVEVFIHQKKVSISNVQGLAPYCSSLHGIYPRQKLYFEESILKHWCVYVCDYVCVCVLLSHLRLFATPWTVAFQAPLSTEFSRQEYWSGLTFPSP